MLALNTGIVALSLFASAQAAAVPKSKPPTIVPTASFDISKTYTDFSSIYKAILNSDTSTKGSAARRKRQDVSTPSSYVATYVDLNVANNSPGYMGFTMVPADEFMIDNCADACNAAPFDANGGLCQFFNIWIPAVNGVPSTKATCAMYYISPNPNTLTNTGQGNITVTQSSGYLRTNLIVPADGTFESFTCLFPTPQGSFSCSTVQAAGWVGTSPPGGLLDATIVNDDSSLGRFFAHMGNSYAQLGGGTTDQFPGTLSIAKPITGESAEPLQAGEPLVLSFFIRAQHAPQPNFPDITPQLNITWNGVVVSSTTGYHPNWEFMSINVVSTGRDTLNFTGGSFPEFITLDDIYLFRRNI